MLRLFALIPIRWKVQFIVGLILFIAIVVDRVLAYGVLSDTIDLVEGQIDIEARHQLESVRNGFVLSSIWQSGLLFCIAVWISSYLALVFSQPIEELLSALRLLASGKVTHRVAVESSHDEYDELKEAYNAVAQRMDDVLGTFDDFGREISSCGVQIAGVAREIADATRAAEEQSRNVGTSNEQLQQVTVSVQSVAREATERVSRTDSRAAQGKAFIEGNIREMELTVREVMTASEQVTDLSQAAKKIYDIIEAIRTIAEQTNLLALNAAIEASRAGEQGRGFAVVAEEVRNLSTRTTASTGEISEIINTLTSHVGQVAQTMEEVVKRVHTSQQSASSAAELINSIAIDVSATSLSNKTIAEATEDQLRQFHSLSLRLKSLFESTRDGSSKIAATAAVGEELHDRISDFDRLLSQYEFNRRTHFIPRPGEQRTQPRLSGAFRVRVHVVGQAGGEAVATEISMKGMRLRTEAKLVEGEIYTFEIYAPIENLNEYSRQEPVTVSGRVVWYRESSSSEGLAGIHFRNLTEAQSAALSRCFDFFGKASRFKRKQAQTLPGQDMSYTMSDNDTSDAEAMTNPIAIESGLAAPERESGHAQSSPANG